MFPGHCESQSSAIFSIASVLPGGFQLIRSLLLINFSAFPPSVIFVDMRDAAAEGKQMSGWSSNRFCSLGGGAVAVERACLGACSAETLYRGTECETGFYCVPVRERIFYDRQ